jgi:hypothetical protein
MVYISPIRLQEQTTSFYNHSRVWLLILLYSLGILVVTNNEHFQKIVLDTDTGERSLYAFLAICVMFNILHLTRLGYAFSLSSDSARRNYMLKFVRAMITMTKVTLTGFVWVLGIEFMLYGQSSWFDRMRSYLRGDITTPGGNDDGVAPGTIILIVVAAGILFGLMFLTKFFYTNKR